MPFNLPNPQKGIIPLAVVFIVLAGIILGGSLIRQRTNFLPHAQEEDCGDNCGGDQDPEPEPEPEQEQEQPQQEQPQPDETPAQEEDQTQPDQTPDPIPDDAVSSDPLSDDPVPVEDDQPGFLDTILDAVEDIGERLGVVDPENRQEDQAEAAQTREEQIERKLKEALDDPVRREKGLDELARKYEINPDDPERDSKLAEALDRELQRGGYRFNGTLDDFTITKDETRAVGGAGPAGGVRGARAGAAVGYQVGVNPCVGVIGLMSPTCGRTTPIDTNVPDIKLPEGMREEPQPSIAPGMREGEVPTTDPGMREGENPLPNPGPGDTVVPDCPDGSSGIRFPSLEGTGCRNAAQVLDRKDPTVVESTTSPQPEAVIEPSEERRDKNTEGGSLIWRYPQGEVFEIQSDGRTHVHIPTIGDFDETNSKITTKGDNVVIEPNYLQYQGEVYGRIILQKDGTKIEYLPGQIYIRDGDGIVIKDTYRPQREGKPATPQPAEESPSESKKPQIWKDGKWVDVDYVRTTRETAKPDPLLPEKSRLTSAALNSRVLGVSADNSPSPAMTLGYAIYLNSIDEIRSKLQASGQVGDDEIKKITKDNFHYEQTGLKTASQITVATGGDGVAEFPAPNSYYSLKVNPIQGVDLSVPEFFNTGNNKIIAVGLKPGSGKVAYLPKVKSLFRFLKPALAADEEKEVKVVTFYDKNGNGKWDSSEKEVPWAGVSVQMKDENADLRNSDSKPSFFMNIPFFNIQLGPGGK